MNDITREPFFEDEEQQPIEKTEEIKRPDNIIGRIEAFAESTTKEWLDKHKTLTTEGAIKTGYQCIDNKIRIFPGDNNVILGRSNQKSRDQNGRNRHENK